MKTRNTTAINFICKESKMDKKGYAPIQLSIIINGKRTIIQLPRKERPSLFRKGSKELIEYLDVVRAKVNEAQSKMMMMNLPITSAGLKNYLMNGDAPAYSLKDLFKDYLGLLEGRVNTGDLTKETYLKYVRVFDAFLMFMGKDKEIYDVGPTDINAFYAMLNESEKLSTTAGKMVKLKSVFLWARDMGKITALPFAGIKIHKPRPNIEYLTPEEIRRIYSTDTGIERLDKVRDLFIFQCCSGMSFGDMMRLVPGDLSMIGDSAIIKKKREKTNVEFTSVLIGPGLEIFRKYGGCLPKISNQKMNAYLKEIADIAGIKRELTSHMGRRSYATYLCSMGVSIKSVAKTLGHTLSSAVTEYYYADKVDESIVKEIEEKVGKTIDFVK